MKVVQARESAQANVWGSGGSQVHSAWSEPRGCREDEGAWDSMKAVELTSYSLFHSRDPARPSSYIAA